MKKLNSDKRSSSITPSTALLNQKLGISTGYRNLTPSEITLLRQSKQEIAARLKPSAETQYPESSGSVDKVYPDTQWHDPQPVKESANTVTATMPPVFSIHRICSLHAFQAPPQ